MWWCQLIDLLKFGTANKSMQLVHYIAKFVFEVSFWRFESSIPIDFPDLNITDGDSLTII